MVLSDSRNCNLNFTDKLLDTAAPGYQSGASFDPATFAIQRYNNAVIPQPVITTVIVGDEISGFQVTDLKLKLSPPASGDVYFADIVLIASEQGARRTIGSGVVNEVFPIAFNTETTGNLNEVKITSCASNIQSGSGFNASSCDSGEVATGIDAGGNVICAAGGGSFGGIIMASSTWVPGAACDVANAVTGACTCPAGFSVGTTYPCAGAGCGSGRFFYCYR